MDHFNHTLRSKTMLALTAASSIVALAVPTALSAQTIGEESEAGADPANAGEIVVTGSRIKRAGFDTLEPAKTLGADYLEQKATTNISDALATTPSFNMGQNAQGNQGAFSAGQTFADRFGLGSSRTLTVVNGRRFVSTNAPSVQGNIISAPTPPGLQVDLNIIPTLLVDRIENLAIGGAPTYGSDAIAGVVNIILKSKYEGLTLSAQSGITSRGDNFRANLSGLGGWNFAEGRGNIMVAASYDRSEGLVGNARKRISDAYSFAANPLAGSPAALYPGRTAANDGRVNGKIPFNTGTGDGISNTVLIRNTRVSLLTEGGLLLPVDQLARPDMTPMGFGPSGTTRLQFDRQGNIVPFTPSTPFDIYGSGGDGYNLTQSVALLADVERFTGTLNGTFEVTSNVELFAEGLFFKGTGRELVDQGTFNSSLFGGRDVSNGTLRFYADDPRLSAQARGILNDLGVTEFDLSRANTDISTDASRSKTYVYRGVGGVRGNFEGFGRTFNFEASFNYGRTEGHFYKREIIQQRFVNALNVKLDSAGRLVCDPSPRRNVAAGLLSPIADPGCIPLDPFGSGRPSAEAVDYITAPTHARSMIEQTVLNAFVGSSNLVETWAGPVGFSLGYERRREKGAFDPDRNQQLGTTRNAPISAASGSFVTNEVFGELLIPLASPRNDIPMLYSLDVEGRARYVDNSINGGFTTYTIGGRYRPVEDIELRGNFTHSLRAPAIVELFTPRAVATGFFTDPCDSGAVANGPNPAVRARNCAAFYQSYGLDPATFISNADELGVPTISGGNPDLRNEVADAYTFGVVLRPRFLPNFQAAIDWNRIKVTGNIAQLTAGDIGQGCYDNPDFNAGDPDNGNSFCRLFTRTRGGPNNGQIVADPINPGVRSTFLNGASIRFEGLTADLSYRNIRLDGLGLTDASLSLGGSFFYLHKLCTSTNGVTTTCVQGTTGDPSLEGGAPSPRYSGQLNATLDLGKVSLFAEANYASSMKYDLLATPEFRDILKVKGRWDFNTAISFEVTERTSMQFSVTNLFDKMAPFPLTQGELLGRRFALNFKHSL